MDAVEPFAKYIVKTKYEDLPSEVVAATKQHLMHTLATVIGGSNAPGCKTIVDLVTEWGGREESTILVYGGKIPAVHAALANGTMGHALDFCMNDDRTDYKTSVVAIPASLAAMEYKGRLPRRELITAIYLGVELGIRIALAINPKPAHALSPVLGAFSSAAAVSKILLSDVEQILDALSIAYCQVCGSGSSIVSPSLTKRLRPGLAARSGVFAALLAQKGFRGNRNIMQGAEGYFMSYHGQEGDLEQLTADLGHRYEIVNVYPKGYPCCRALHASIDATLHLIQEHDIKPEEIKAVTVYEGFRNPSIADKSEPDLWERLRHPRGVVDAQFSVPWGVASAIVNRGVFIENFTEEGITKPEVHKMADRVVVNFDPELDEVKSYSTPAVVEIESRAGRVFTNRVDFAKGNPKNPISMEETRDTFRRCAAYAAKPISGDSVQKAIEMIDRLEDVEDTSEITRLLVG